MMLDHLVEPGVKTGLAESQKEDLWMLKHQDKEYLWSMVNYKKVEEISTKSCKGALYNKCLLI